MEWRHLELIYGTTLVYLLLATTVCVNVSVVVSVYLCVVVQTEKKIVKMNEEIKKSLSLDNAVSSCIIISCLSALPPCTKLGLKAVLHCQSPILAGAGYQLDLLKKAGFRPRPNSGTALVNTVSSCHEEIMISTLFHCLNSSL